VDFIEYRTREGDRWDLLAATFYGDAGAFERIVSANPAVPLDPVLPGGLLLRVPLLEERDAERTLAAAQLPPWKRGA
jgi:phage tail protein X